MTATIPATFETDQTVQNFCIQELAAGRSNANGTLTLAASVGTTTVTAKNCGAGSAVLLFPTTANGAAAIATTYVSTVSPGSFVLTHTNNVQTDRSFFFVCLG